LGNKNYFQNIYKSQAFKTWSGYAFENVCHLHIVEIKRALGIEGVITQSYYWRNEHAQIDILLERADDVVNLIECKYHNELFTIDKKYAKELENKEQEFQKSTAYQGSIQTVMLTSQGLKENAYSKEIVSYDLRIGLFFE
jgi:hypothetical protein